MATKKDKTTPINLQDGDVVSESKKPKETEEAAETVSPSKGRVVAIVGFAETSRMQVLKEPPETEIWSLNRCYVFLNRWDRWYELHEEDLYSGKTGLREDGYMDLLKNSTVPIFMQHPHPDFPMAVQFPKNEIIHMFQQDEPGGFDYFTTSIAYMLAHVAYEHIQGNAVAEMHMYGVDMSAFTEYSEQLPCVNFWLGVLKGLGIKVVIPAVSPILKCAMPYGRHGERPLQKMAKARLQNHKGSQTQLTADGAAVAGVVAEYGGLFKHLDDLLAAIANGETAPIDLVNGFKTSCKNRKDELSKHHAHLMAELNAVMGSIRESQHWIVALNAAQTEDEEPEVAKTPRL